MAWRSQVGEGGADLSERVAGTSPAKFFGNQSKRRIDVYQHQAGRQSQRPDTLPGDPGVADGVLQSPLLKLVETAIDLDSQTDAVTVEVETVGSKRVLPPKSQAPETVRPEHAPKGDLGRRHCLAMGSRPRW